MKARDLYRVLGIRPNSSQETITKGYRRKSMKLHPDRNSGDDEAKTEYQAVQDAYAVLSDPARRAQYDATGDTSAPHGSIESELMNVLFPLLMQCVQEHANNPYSKIEQVDLVVGTTSKLNAQIKTAEKTQEQMKKAHATLKSIVGRITNDGPDNLLDAGLRSQLESMDEPLRQIAAELDKLTRAKNHLKTYKCRVDAGGGSTTGTNVPLMLGFGYATWRGV